MDSSQGKKGQQRTACDSCRHRKIRCDALKPACTWCRHYLAPCTYGTGRLKSGKQNSVPKPIKWPLRAKPHGQELDFAQALGNLNGIGFLSVTLGFPPFVPAAQNWIRAKLSELLAAQRVSLGAQFSQTHLSCPLSHASWTQAQPHEHLAHAISLPDRKAVEKCVRYFERSSIRPVFPVLHPPLFEETIEMAYSQANSHSRNLTARACVLAFLVFAHLLELGSPLGPSPDINRHIETVQSLLPMIVQSDPTIAIQACVILLSAQFFAGQLKSAAVIKGIAANLLFSLGGHMQRVPLESERGVDGIAHRHIRNLFWVCYTIDKELSFRLRQPPALSDEYCDLTLSADYLHDLACDLEPSTKTAELPACNFFPSDIKLSQIKSCVFRSLYSAMSVQKSGAEILSAIRTLDDHLESWRLSLPPEYRPALSSLPGGNQGFAKPADIRALIVQLEYYHCLTVIHQATSRCAGWVQGQEDIPPGISTSFALAVEACRSTLLYLKTAQYTLNAPSFRLVLYYPVVASVMLFCHILESPHDPLARQDHALIAQFPCLAYNHLLPHLTTAELLHVAHLKSFFHAMGQLALSAIANAESKSGDALG